MAYTFKHTVPNLLKKSRVKLNIRLHMYFKHGESDNPIPMHCTHALDFAVRTSDDVLIYALYSTVLFRIERCTFQTSNHHDTVQVTLPAKEDPSI